MIRTQTLRERIRPFRRADPDPLIQRYRESLEEAEDAQSRLDDRARRAEGFVPRTELRLDLLEPAQEKPKLVTGWWKLAAAILAIVALYAFLIWVAVWLIGS